VSVHRPIAVLEGHLEEAQARGITVLAISGDSGDSSSSAWGIGNTWFPGSMAYDTFGDVAVGGDSQRAVEQ